jgi:hypothetical protein
VVFFLLYDTLFKTAILDEIIKLLELTKKFANTYMAYPFIAGTEP